jgi:uncharacterized protein YbjT (DUF2867 family)
MDQTATLIGASGLIGSHLLQLLLKDNTYSTIKIIVRRPQLLRDPKLQEIVIDFGDNKALEQAIAGSAVVFSAVGTTQKKVKGDKNAYRKVDFDIPVHAAKAAAKYGVYSFSLVSSVGANATNNNNFYLKLKGIVEEAVSKESIPQLHIMRPSMLLGDRKEKRIGESIAAVLMPVFSIFLFGKFTKYRAIKAEDVARAMLQASKSPVKGIHIYEYEEIKKLAELQ